MADCCEFGTFTLTVNGQIVSARGQFTLTTTNFEREGGSNMDGSIWSSKKPVPAKASGSIDFCSANVEELWDLCDVTVTFEFSGNRSIVFNKARVIGRPELNTENGETSGFEIIAQSARVVR